VLSGVARSPLEKSTVENIAIKVRGVKTVQNNVVLRP
jgi:osmotically-inducible protein OsmY